MQINKFIFLVGVLSPLLLFSQAQITGVVIDSVKQPIEFANVVLLDNNNNIVVGTITDKKGEFLLNHIKGNYFLKVSFLGYSDYMKKINISNNLDIEEITLFENTSSLGEVEVTGKKRLFEQKVDRLIFNISDNDFAKGKTALETLQLAPTVWVSSDGSISINGRGGVGVVINERLLPAEIVKSYLSSLRSEDIEKVEIISDAPAEYEAEFQSGILKIILKKNIEKGFKGNINSSYTQHRYASFGKGGSLNYKTGKWLWYGNYNYSQNKDYFDREVETIYDIENIKQQTNFQSIERSFNNSYRFGFDYDINSKQNIGVEYYTSNLNFEEAIDNEAVSYNSNDKIDEIVKGNYPGKVDRRKQLYTINYKWEIDSIGKQLSMVTDYFAYSKERNTDYFDDVYNAEETFLNAEVANSLIFSDINILTSKVDYVHPTSKGTFQGGLKYSNADLQNAYIHKILNNGVFEIDPQKTTSYKFSEKVSAAYLKTTSKIKGVEYQVGLRGEYTQNSFSKNDEQNYFNVFPSIFIKHYINKEKNTSLKYYYGKKINRPSYTLMNPYEVYIDKYTIFRGNENLKPEYNNNFSLSLLIGDRNIFQLYYFYTKDFFGDVEYRNPQDPNINIETTENIGRKKSFGFYNFNSIRINKSWNTNTGLGLNYSQNTSYDKTFNEYQTYFFINHKSFINLPLGIDCTINSRYMSPVLDGIYVFDDKFNLDIEFQKEVLKNKGIISFEISDIFYGYGKYSLKSYYLGQSSETNIERSSQKIVLSFSYNFSSGSKFKKQRKERSNREELRRI